MFYGDPGENVFISKMFKNPYKEHFYHWFLNIIEQNRDQQSFPKMLSRLPEVIEHFFVKQWHETPTQHQVREDQGRSDIFTYSSYHLGVYYSPASQGPPRYQ